MDEWTRRPSVSQAPDRTVPRRPRGSLQNGYGLDRSSIEHASDIDVRLRGHSRAT